MLIFDFCCQETFSIFSSFVFLKNDVSRNYRQINFLMNDKPLSAQSKSSLFEALWQANKTALEVSLAQVI